MHQSSGNHVCLASLCVLVCTSLFSWPLPAVADTPKPVVRYWSFNDSGIRGTFQHREGNRVFVLDESNRSNEISFDALSNEDKLYLTWAEDTDHPTTQPAWIDGYPIRFLVRVTGDLAGSSSKTVIARIPSGGWLAGNNNAVLIQTASGATSRADVRSVGEHGDALIQFPRLSPERFYWVYARASGASPENTPASHAATAKPPSDFHPEGLSMEIRHTDHTPGNTWEQMLPSLDNPDGMVASSIAVNCSESGNPYPSKAHASYAVSFRGYIKIDAPGTYRFLLNGSDATYLKIGDQVLRQQTGRNPRMRKYSRKNEVGDPIALTAGVYPITTHHVVFDTKSPVNVSVLLWLRPGDSEWEIVPHTVYPRAMFAIPAQVESQSPQGYAVFDAGFTDTLGSHGLRFNLVELRAHATSPPPQSLAWNLPGQSTMHGTSVTWVLENAGVYRVTLQSNPLLPGFTRRIVVNANPEVPSPGSLETLESELSSRDLTQSSDAQLGDIAAVLERCPDFQHPKIAQRLQEQLEQRGVIDPATQITLYEHLLRHKAQQGTPAELAQSYEQYLAQFTATPCLADRLRWRFAQIAVAERRDPATALDQLRIALDNTQRTRPDIARRLAVMMGDIFLQDLGDLRKADTAYELAEDLQRRAGNRERGDTMSPIRRGTMFRQAEQLLDNTDITTTSSVLMRVQNKVSVRPSHP